MLFLTERDHLNRDQNRVNQVNQAKMWGKSDPGREQQVQRPRGNKEELQERQSGWNGVSQVKSVKR